MSDDVALEATNELQAGYDLFYRGKGEVLEVSGEHERGARTVSFDAEHNLITDQQITEIPKADHRQPMGCSRRQGHRAHFRRWS